MKKKIILICLLLSLHAQLSLLGEELNLIKNGDFEKISGGKPVEWTTSAWQSGSNITKYSSGNVKPKSGKIYAVIENLKDNDSRYVQHVEVEPNTVYKLSCFIRSKINNKNKTGASISVYDPQTGRYSQDYHNTKGKWQYVEYYIRTGRTQKDVTICLRIGGFGNVNSGKAEFDDFRMIQVQNGGDAIVENLEGGSSSEVAQGARKVKKENKLVSIILTIAIILIILLAGGAVIYFFIIQPRLKKNLRKEQETEPLPDLYLNKKGKVHYNKYDFLIMGVLVLVYAIVAYTHLGSLTAPKTHWQPGMKDEYFYADLGASRPIQRIYYYTGLPGASTGKFQVEYSNDAETWEKSVILEAKSVFYWFYNKIKINARYIKISTLTPNVQLKEMAFFGIDREKPLEVKQIFVPNKSFKTKGSASNIFDEQDTVVYRPTMYYGMPTGFDELYHARTAYEHITGVEPYEISHPPLGKLIIAGGILIFGMNPFGWRFMGTTAGIIMIIVMYLFGKQLFKKTEYAFICAFLMAFDFMTFVQTRIATIDSYVVLFMLLMFYFMYKYYVTDFYKTGLKKTLIPLLFSGLAWGLALATKMNSLLGGAGIAFIFFITIGKRISAFLHFRKKLRKKSFLKNTESRERIEYFQSRFGIHMLITFGWCVLVFIILPLGIYIASFIPFMLLPGPGHDLAAVFKNIDYMYNYHAGLAATHPFSTRWFEWPIIWQPMWYHMGQDLPTGKSENLVAMGNPAVWWIGTLAALALAGKSITVFIRRIKETVDSKMTGSRFQQFIGKISNADKIRFFIMAGVATQYLLWIFSPRQLTFIYHFFQSVPFIIFCTVFIIIEFLERAKQRGGLPIRWRGTTILKVVPARSVIYFYMAVVLFLFIMFYPVLSYTIVDKSYLKLLKWFPKWPIYY